MRIGVLALQGDVREHLAVIEKLGQIPVAVKTEAQLGEIDGLIIPGGESTTISKLAVNFGLMPKLRDFCKQKPVLGTCAGLILLSDKVEGALSDQELIGGLPIVVERNAYGGQTHSFEAEIQIAGTVENVAFIRAPRILDVGPAEVLAEYQGEAVAVKFGNLVGASFHPELTGGTKLHELFVTVVEDAQAS